MIKLKTYSSYKYYWIVDKVITRRLKDIVKELNLISDE